ncbi:Mitochondrial transcription factor 1 [Neolecta irregularis DAH-3]|uniref:rRNA adenine N(6)-methyltransferase n=1 Tax=Neolecta irregularis (strain DAH-3) TaxID=1198029 RepID=A0A1U7LP79_NEOID|nr:Mitochondrial transcription factor 1 [Neolecta irregularis DAH-3]|eukprot:OLL24454.1 Mitochondrial transcription factor 1 [Neolecta irregularis DAH-3]
MRPSGVFFRSVHILNPFRVRYPIRPNRRVFLTEEHVARSLVDGLDLKNSDYSHIVEMNPGHGSISRAVLNVTNPKKYILLEPAPIFSKDLDLLARKFEGVVQNIPQDGFNWNTFENLFASELKEVAKQSDDNLHSKILFIATLPIAVKGEQLVSQWLNCIYYRHWMQHFGRVRMILLLRDKIGRRLVSEPKGINWSKLGIVAKLLTDSRVIAVDQDSFREDPVTNKDTVILDKADFVPATSMYCVDIRPKRPEVSLIFEEFEYVVKTLMFLRKVPIRTNLRLLGIGAQEGMVSKCSEVVDLDKSASDLTLNEFIQITQIYSDWPLKPNLQSITRTGHSA